MFSMLSRYFVFAKDGQGGDWSARWQRSWPEWLLVAATIIGWLCLNQIRLSHDIFWQFWIARQLLGGAKLYVDIWELNPPLWFWSAVPIQWLAEQTGVAWQALLIAQVLALGAVSALLVGRMIEQVDNTDRCIMMLAQFWLVTIVPLSDMGQREHLAIIGSLPYAALIARRNSGHTVSPLLAVASGVFGGYGFAFKHYFLLIPLLLELWLLLKLRRAWRPLRPELATLAILGLVYAVSVVAFTPEFLTRMVPMVRMAYAGFEVPLSDLFTPPWVMFWVASIVFLFTWRRQWQHSETAMAKSLFQALTIVSAAFAFAYFVQQKGWYYQSLPITAALAFAIVLALISMRHGRALPVLVGIALLALPATTALTPRPAKQPVAILSDQLLRDVPNGETVFIATTAPRLAWPTIEQRQLVWPSRAFVLWMLPIIAEAEVSSRTTRDLRDLAGLVLRTTSLDIRCRPPERLIFQSAPIASLGTVKFDIREFLMRDGDLRAFISKHYVLQPSPGSVFVYQRRGPVRSIVSTQCRSIR